MKKDLYTLIINSILAVCITVGVVLGTPKTSVISNSKAVDVFSPSQIFSQIKDKYNKNNTENKTQKDNEEKTDTTAPAQNISSNITDIPSDIQALMDKAQKNISNEKKICKITEKRISAAEL